MDNVNIIDECVDKTFEAHIENFRKVQEGTGISLPDLKVNNFRIQFEKLFLKKDYSGFTRRGAIRERMQELGEDEIMKSFLFHQIKLQNYQTQCGKVQILGVPGKDLMTPGLTSGEMTLLTNANLKIGNVDGVLLSFQVNSEFREALISMFLNNRYGEYQIREELDRLPILDPNLQKALQNLESYYQEKKESERTL